MPDAPRSTAALRGPRAPEHSAGLEDCDGGNGYVVLVVDPVTGAVDAYGPFTGPDASHDADRRRAELEAEDLHEVTVQVVRLYHR